MNSNLLIVSSAQSGKYYLVEYNSTSYTYTSISEDFALQSSLKCVRYEKGPFFWSFDEFVKENRPTGG